MTRQERWRRRRERERRKRIIIFGCGLLIGALIWVITSCSTKEEVPERELPTPTIEPIDIFIPEEETIEVEFYDGDALLAEYEEEMAQKRMVAQLVQAEAGNQPLTGMRFVVDVVLNRVDDPRFPDTIEEVIFQGDPIQFSVTANGMFEAAEDNISDDAWLAVELEWEERLDYGILYFSSTTDPVNGKNAFKYFGHWFSY